MRDDGGHVHHAVLKQAERPQIRKRPPLIIMPPRRPHRRHQRRFEELHPVHDTQVHARVAVSVEQYGRLLPDQTGNGSHDRARTGRFDQKFHAPALSPLGDRVSQVS